MNPGDQVIIHMHDTADGLRIDLTDTTTRQTGSMTASIANGFGHILYKPGAQKCRMDPYAFHPEYSTANPRGNTWSAHTYNVAFSDEIGHFENCLTLDADFNCAVSAGDEGDGTPDADDVFCVPAEDSLLIKINGCFAGDGDWDGRRTRTTGRGPTRIPRSTPRSTHHRCSSRARLRTATRTTRTWSSKPTCHGSRQPVPSSTRRSATGRPARTASIHLPGAAFYPFYSTRMANGTCTWQEGGRFIPGTINDFGGSSTSEYGPLLLTPYPTTGKQVVYRYNNFQNDLHVNPCPHS